MFRSCARTLLVLVGVVGASLAIASSAGAIAANIHIAKTGGQGVYLRPSPDTSGPGLRLIPEGASPDYNCFTYGQNINGVPVWFNVNYAGATGYYASYYDDSSYHSDAELTSKYGIPKCGAAPAPSPAPQPSPAPAPSQPSSPASITASVGGPYGCSNCSAINVQVHNFPTGSYTYACHDNSGPGGSDTTFYSHAVTVSDPNQGNWPGVFCYDNAPYTAYIVMNGARSNSVTFSGGAGPGTPAQGGSGPPAPLSSGGATNPTGGEVGPGPLPGGGSLYFSPYTQSRHGNINYPGLPNGKNAPSGADAELSIDQWYRDADGNVLRTKEQQAHTCPALKFVTTDQLGIGGVARGRRITTLAAWSEARNVPALFLKAHPSWYDQINYIILYDPGTQAEFANSPCNKPYNISQIYADWLSKPGRKLVIISGQTTADKRHRSADGHGHAGLQDTLFPAIKKAGAAVRGRVVVCNNDDVSHEDIWVRYRYYMFANSPQITTGTCPSGAFGWNP